MTKDYLETNNNNYVDELFNLFVRKVRSELPIS